MMMTTNALSPSIGVRRRHRSDPKAAQQSSSPFASPAKRQRHLPVTPADSNRNNRTQATLRLPIDAVSASFLFLDVGDVPSASVICKDWLAALKKVEEDLWLGLIRKHCPSVEEVTKMLQLSSSPEGSNSTSTAIPAPSLSWRGQFQRQVLLTKPEDADAVAQTTAAEKPPPKPLSSYLFQVDLVLYQERKGQTGKGEQVGVVTRVFSDCTFNSNGRIPLKMDQLEEEMAPKCNDFTTFDVRVTIYGKATGRQAIVHNHGMEDWWDSNLWFFGFGRIADAYKLDGFGTSDAISTMLSVEKIGCVANGGDDDSWEFFSPPSCKGSCKCNTAWSCFWNMMLELWIVTDCEWDIIDMNKDQQLRVLEEIVEYK